VSWSQEELVAAAYAVVFVFVLVYVAIIAAKLARLQRETAELVALARKRPPSGTVTGRAPDYAPTVAGEQLGTESS
jgi:CcmD family protein